MFDRETRNVKALELDKQRLPAPSSPGGLFQISFGFLDRMSPILTGNSWGSRRVSRYFLHYRILSI
jgi:hypothetical protein